MRFIIVSQYAGSRKHGMVLRNYNWGKALVALGHEVTIVAASFSHSRNFQPETQTAITEEYIDGIRYLWLKGMRYNPESYVMRIAAMVEFTLRFTFLSRRRLGAADVVASSPQPFVVYPAFFLASRLKAKRVFDVRDLWPLTLKKLGNVTSYNPFIWLMQRAENFACRKCDVLTSVPRHAEPYFKQHGLRDGKFLSLPNGVLSLETAIEPLPEQHLKLIEDVKRRNGFIVGYAGALGKANALHSLLSALKAANERAHVVLVGRGPYLDSLKDQVAELGIEHRVHFLPPVKPDSVPEFLEKIDVAYIGLTRSDLFQYGASPTKLNDYMLAAKPVLYAVGDLENPIEQSGGGICCEAENVEEIAAAIDKFSNMPMELVQEMGGHGCKWLAENHLLSTHMKRLIEKLEL